MYIRIILLTIVAVVIAFFSQYNNSHIIIFVSSYRFDMALSLFCIAVLVLFVILYYIIRASVNIHRIPAKIRRWKQSHALLTSRKYLNYAGINFFEGRFIRAYKNAILSTNKETNADNKFLGLMLAFKSSSYMCDTTKESQILSELDKFQQQKWQLAKFMTLSESLYSTQKYSQCLDGINNVLSLDRKHIPATKLLLKTYLRLENYNKAYDTLSWLIKNNYLEAHYTQSYKIRVFKGLFSQVSDIHELKSIYKKLDKNDKNDIVIGKFYLMALIRLNSYESAIAYVANTQSLSLVINFDDELIILAKRLTDKDEINDLIKVCEKLIITNKSSSILLALGILYYSLSKFGKATEYLDESIKLKANLNAYLYLLFIAKSTNNQSLLDMVQNKLIGMVL